MELSDIVFPFETMRLQKRKLVGVKIGREFAKNHFLTAVVKTAAKSQSICGLAD
jgi:hypothetical protein